MLSRAEFIAWHLKHPKNEEYNQDQTFLATPRMRLNFCTYPYYKLALCQIQPHGKLDKYQILLCVTASPFFMDRVTYLILAGETATLEVSARKNKKILRVVTQPRIPVEGTTDPTQRNKLVGHSTSALTNPSTRDTILPKKIRKVTIQHQRRRGKITKPSRKLTNRQRRQKESINHYLTFSEVTNLSL